MKKILTGMLMLACITAFAQRGSVRGTIKTADGYPAESVTVSLKGTPLATASDRSGHYELPKVHAGRYTLVASFAGQEAREVPIQVHAGQPTVVPEMMLKENAQELNEVVVSGSRVKKESPFVAKMPLKDLENPQVYSVVSSELLKQQAIVNYDDALRNVPGISRTWESTGRSGGDGASYFALRGLEAQATMYNGLPGLTNGDLDPADIERIEVIKGPTGTLFGSSVIAYGGLINTVTKKPYFSGFGGEVNYNVGSFGLNRISSDFNIPLSDSKKIALRIISAYHSENSFQDAGFKKSFYLAPSLSYEVNGRLSFQFMTQILSEERAVAPIFFHTNRADPMQFKTVGALNLNTRLSFTSNDLTISNPRFNLQGQMLYKLSNTWTSQTVFSSGVSKSSGYYGYIWPDVTGTNLFGQYISDKQSSINTTDIQQNFNGDFSLGTLRNRLVIGLDAFTRTNIDNSSGWGLIRNVTPQGGVSYSDPYTCDSLPPVYLTRSSVNNLLAGSGDPAHSNVTNSAYSLYASDVINITPGLLAMASARVDHFVSAGEKSDPSDGYNQTAVSPKFGVVYQPLIDRLSLFGNYMNGFVNSDPMQVADADGSNPRIKSFKPQQANQLEFGIKSNLFRERLSATVSYYDIKVSNRITGDPNNQHNFLQGGKMRSRGFEVDVNANPVKGLNLIAGYSHNDSKVLTGDNDFYSTPGKSAGGQGPNDLVNLWATYRFTTGAMKHFGIGFGGNHAGRYKVVDSDITGDFYLPAYTVLNGSLFYNGKDVRFTVNVNNLTNETYYIGYWSVNPQKPLNVVAGFSYKF